MDKRKCSECEGQGGGERCQMHGSGCPCAVEYVCETCEGVGYFCGDCRELVREDELCPCSLPMHGEAVAP